MSYDTLMNSAETKRAEQLKRWEESETNREPSVPKSDKGRKIKFSSGCVFLAACLAGDKEEIVNLLENGADINTANVDGLTALHQACIDDNLDMVEFLVEHGADINRQDNEGWTPLHATASCGFVSIARYLVEHGADIAAVNSDGELAVDLAVDIAHLSPMIEYMQKLIAEHNIDCDKARRAEEEMMLSDAKRWLRSDASEADTPHPKTGATALHVAAAKGYKKVLSLLLAGRANVDKQDNDGWTPLHAAAHWGQKEAAEMLVDALADMDIRNYAGQTCIDVAEHKMVNFLEVLRANNKRMKRRPSSQISSRISDTIENHIENTPTKFIRVEVKPETKDPVNDDKPKLMPEKINSETAIDEDAPWRRGSAARTRNQPESPPKNQVPEKDVKSTESDVILRRTQSFEHDEKKPITSPPASPNTPVATPNSTAPTTPTTPNTTPIRRSFVPPVRDEESETQRKAHAKRVRETRRSTQGVTLDEIKSAEELVKKKNSTINNNNNTSTEFQNTTTSSTTRTPTTITTTTTTTTPSSPIQQQQQLPIQSAMSAPSAIILPTTTTTTAATSLESTILTTTPTSPISPINDRVPSMTLNYDESESVPPSQITTTATTTTTTESTTKHSSNEEDEEEISATFTVAFNRTKPIHLTDDKIAEQIHSWSPTPPSTPPPIKSPTHSQPPPSITIEEHKDVEDDNEEEEDEEESIDDDEEEVNVINENQEEKVEKEAIVEEKEEKKTEVKVKEEITKKIDSDEESDASEEEEVENEEEEEESSTSEESEKVPASTVTSPTKNTNKKTEVCQNVTSEALPNVAAPTNENVEESQHQQPSSITSPMHSPRMRLTTGTSPTDSPTRIREKRSLFDIDNANSLSLAEKLRNEANKYSTGEIVDETKALTAISPTPSTITPSKPSSSSHDSDNSDRDNVVVMRKSESTPSSPLHMNSAAERRPSWRLKFDSGSKFKLEDASSGTTYPPNNSTIIPSAPAVIAAANLSSSIAQRRINTTNAMNTSNQQQPTTMRPVSAPVGSIGSTNSLASHDSSDRSRDSNTNNTENTISSRRTNNGEDKENDKENDNRSALATQAVIQRRRKPKRRSTGVVHIDMDDLETERQDSTGDNEEKESGNERSSRSRLGSTVSVATDTEIGDTKSNSKDKTENGELIDYKALWEAAKLENDKLKQQLKKKDDEIIQARATVERFTNAQLEVFKTENQRLKEENGALIRVISKLSK